MLAKIAQVAEAVDARDLKSLGRTSRAGSIPALGIRDTMYHPHRWLRTMDSLHPTCTHVRAVYGYAGVGKSQFCLEWLHYWRKKMPHYHLKYVTCDELQAWLYQRSKAQCEAYFADIGQVFWCVDDAHRLSVRMLKKIANAPILLVGRLALWCHMRAALDDPILLKLETFDVQELEAYVQHCLDMSQPVSQQTLTLVLEQSNGHLAHVKSHILKTQQCAPISWQRKLYQRFETYWHGKKLWRC
jgi:hypothetical protein